MELLLLLVSLLALCLALALWWVLGRGGRRSRNRVRRAQRGETDAERLLEECGYSVVERQLSAGWEIYVDGVPRDAQVRADLLVESGDGRRLIAEIKTGTLAPNPTYPPTRRQLLEYWFVFEPDGLLLVDVEAGTVVEIEFAVN